MDKEVNQGFKGIKLDLVWYRWIWRD